MGPCNCLRWIGRVSYYAGLLALVCGGLVQVKIARTLFMAMGLSKRNLLEAGVACLLICIASELRAGNSTCKTKETPGVANKPA